MCSNSSRLIIIHLRRQRESILSTLDLVIRHGLDSRSMIRLVIWMCTNAKCQWIRNARLISNVHLMLNVAIVFAEESRDHSVLRMRIAIMVINCYVGSMLNKPILCSDRWHANLNQYWKLSQHVNWRGDYDQYKWINKLTIKKNQSSF